MVGCRGEILQKGIVRERAFEAEEVLFGQSKIAVGTQSGWHHHGTRHLYGYIVSGRLRFDYVKTKIESIEVNPGDFFHIPVGLVHRDVNPDQTVEAVVVNILLAKGRQWSMCQTRLHEFDLSPNSSCRGGLRGGKCKDSSPVGKRIWKDDLICLRETGDIRFNLGIIGSVKSCPTEAFTMGPAKGIKVLLLIVIVGVLGSAFGLVRTASASQHFVIIADFVVAGSGSAGSGSLAVAAVFSTFPASNGAGAFSGSLGVPSGPASGLFSLTVINPANAPVLHCPNGQVSAAGKVVSGSFLNDQVIIAGCIGSGVSGAFLSGTAELPGNDFSAIGTGTGTAAVIHGTGFSSFVAAGVTSGSGSAGSGTIYTAEADGIASDGSLFGGGAFTGTTTTDHLTQQGNTWQLRSAFLQPGCTLNTIGVTGSFGSFPNQPVSSTYTLVTCPPTSLGPQTARFVYVVGGETNPIYKGTSDGAITSIQVST